MSRLWNSGIPGIGPERTATPRKVLLSERGARYMPKMRTIDASLSRDPGNGVDIDVLRAGTLLGIVTASGKLAPSIIGLAGEAMDADETEMTVPAGVDTEIVRRIGATGSFKYIVPPTAGGTVQELIATYSSVNTSTHVVTITALGVNEVQTVEFDAAMTGGSIGLQIIDKDGNPAEATVAWDTNWATTLAALETAINAQLGTNAVDLATVADNKGFTITFSGENYAALPQQMADVDISGATSVTKCVVTRTTAGKDGRGVNNGIIAPADGSEYPVTIIEDGYGIVLTDEDKTYRDVVLPRMLCGGMIDTSQIVNYPSDASLRAWIKNKLRLSGQWIFNDDF